MAFGDSTVNNNTTPISVNVSNQQALPNSNAAQETNVVIDFDLQKMLQAMGLTMEQWQTMSLQEQTSAREIYAKNQQQNLLNEQAGMGIQGLSIEKTIDESSNEQLSDEVIEETHVHNHEEHSADETSDTHNNAFKWAFTLKENKRQYLIQKMKDSEQFKDKNLTDEDYENLLNEYITYKTKERFIEDEVPPRFLKIENEAWDALSLEEKTELVNSEWDKLDERRKERFEGKTLNDYSLMVSAGIKEEDYNNLSILDKMEIQNQELEKQLQQIETKIQELQQEESNHSHEDNVTCHLDEEISSMEEFRDQLSINKEKTSETCDFAREISEKIGSSIELNDEYKNIVKEAGLRFDGTAYDSKKLVDYINSKTQGLESDEAQKEKEKIIFALLHSAENETDKQNSAAVIARSLNKLNLKKDDILNILNDKDLAQSLSVAITNGQLNSEEVEEFTNTAVGAIEEVEGQGRDTGDLENFKIVVSALSNRGNGTKNLKVTKRLAASESKTVASIYVNATNNDENKEAKLFGVKNYIYIQDPDLKVTAAAGAFVGENGSYQLELQEAMGNDEDLLVGQTVAIKNGDIEEEVQTPFAKNVRVNSEKTDSAVEIQKGLIDAIATGFTAENQKNAYEDIITNTSYVEVQEHAASSIYKLDESIREWAEQYTKSLGIERVTNAIKTEPPVKSEKDSSVNKTVSVSYTSKAKTPEIVIQQDIIKDPVVNIIDNKNPEETKEVNFDFTKSNDREKFVQYFMQNPIEMAKYLAKTSAKQKEIFITLLCNSSKETAIKLAEQSPSFALLILRSSQIKVNVQGAVANKILEKYQKGHEVYIAALEYNNKFAIGKPSKKNEEEKGFLIRA